MAWITAAPMADAGAVWLALSDVQDETGLVPITLALPGGVDAADTGLVWDDFGFWVPADLSLVDGISAATVLAAGWHVGQRWR